ncbi:selenoprotein domain-containing protein [Ophiocordyceps camponoti-floridani]|uniref:Selenoprotein domain-containing protein n=1 Tax=Ophiocordyceps camponoti-floridani TaxID=2030778 RepID=A0A8H4VDV6_9HYPO|nr:selenoprotein domain-containing protein [Ophiocordyceps camponoti-floridani]
MLRAAYYAQELLSTFNTTLSEVALQPSTGGTFVIAITYLDPDEPPQPQLETTGSTADTADDAATTTLKTKTSVLWNRSVDGGFPETKELKRRVRDVIDPGRNLGHVDRHSRVQPEDDGPPCGDQQDCPT